jgi:TonB family protein
VSRAARLLPLLLVAGLLAGAGSGRADEAGALAAARHEDAIPAGPGLDERLAEIRRRIEGALTYPPLARWRDAYGEALVRFEIDAEGRARDVAVVRSSGQPLLDAAAARAVEDAGVLPRVPGPLEIPIRFELRPK